MRNASGVGIITGPNGTEHIDTFTCCHCCAPVHVKTGVKPDDMGSWCTMCGKMHCAKEACFVCVPFEKKMEQMEAADRVWRSRGYGTA